MEQTTVYNYKQGNVEVSVHVNVAMTNGKADAWVDYAMADGNELIASGRLTNEEYARMSEGGEHLLPERIYDWLA